jgi:selenocysteine-specific translation elongation factor
MDLPGATENLDALKSRFPKVHILPTAAATEEGIAALKEALAASMRNEIICAAI